MPLSRFRSVFFATFAAILLLASGFTATAANRVTFPKDFKQMVIYGDYRRGSSGELAYALKETTGIAKAGQPLPPGTRLVLEINDNGALTSSFVMEKNVDWGLEVEEEKRTGDWHFQQFGAQTRRCTQISPSLCVETFASSRYRTGDPWPGQI
ncbi:hypothetical protein FHX15_005355 [Rhizobium sp. BK650]|uniref:hypothetical protein n=1 Tax=Rhizobium sp. BK650 TaxID=2586990 RepID=UPI0016192E91|nr:hypothetical protein [Rhizobium sp. BK650]MBB3660086.1 hypothetical protein [Rhizobium sp. BK650]